MKTLRLNKILTQGFDVSTLNEDEKEEIKDLFSLSGCGGVCEKCHTPTEPVIKNYDYYPGSTYEPESETYDIVSECCDRDVLILKDSIVSPYELQEEDYEWLSQERYNKSIQDW